MRQLLHGEWQIYIHQFCFVPLDKWQIKFDESAERKQVNVSIDSSNINGIRSAEYKYNVVADTFTCWESIDAVSSAKILQDEFKIEEAIEYRSNKTLIELMDETKQNADIDIIDKPSKTVIKQSVGFCASPIWLDGPMFHYSTGYK